jgi:hypothetical protein
LDYPYCKKPMLFGSIDAFDTLIWTPDGESRKDPTKWSIAENGILLAKYFLLAPATLEAYYCPDCKIVHH